MERVLPGLPADFTRDGGTYKLEVTKPYPEVKEGQFRTDPVSYTHLSLIVGMYPIVQAEIINELNDKKNTCRR